MPAVAQLQAVTLDCPDPKALAEFYQQVTGWEITYDSDEFVYLGADGPGLGFQRVTDHRPPQWPDPETPQQFHLDFTVGDLDEGEKLIVDLGATKTEFQPGGERWRVFLDPAGHPLCLCIED